MDAFDDPLCNELRVGDSTRPGKLFNNPGFVRLQTNGDGGGAGEDRFVDIFKFIIEIGQVMCVPKVSERLDGMGAQDFLGCIGLGFVDHWLGAGRTACLKQDLQDRDGFSGWLAMGCGLIR